MTTDAVASAWTGRVFSGSGRRGDWIGGDSGPERGLGRPPDREAIGNHGPDRGDRDGGRPARRLGAGGCAVPFRGGRLRIAAVVARRAQRMVTLSMPPRSPAAKDAEPSEPMIRIAARARRTLTDAMPMMAMVPMMLPRSPRRQLSDVKRSAGGLSRVRTGTHGR
jgi:hypothetical protein